MVKPPWGCRSFSKFQKSVKSQNKYKYDGKTKRLLFLAWRYLKSSKDKFVFAAFVVLVVLVVRHERANRLR
jgi:hypothetical protein